MSRPQGPSKTPIQTIAIVSPGELGAALGSRLRRAGHPVVTTAAGRSSASAARAQDAGIETLASLAEVLECADVLVSCVPPAQALGVARQVAALRTNSPRPLLYVDLNSIAPRTVRQVEAEASGDGLTFVDASVHGTAARLSDRAVLYASGPQASRVVELFAPILPSEDFGDEPGRASAFKMLLGGISKSLAATMIEIGCAAERQDMLAPLLRACETFYPGLGEALGRTLPTYPRHAARRADEVREIDAMMREEGLETRIVPATWQVLDRVAAASAGRGAEPDAASLAEVLRRLHAAGVCDVAPTRSERKSP